MQAMIMCIGWSDGRRCEAAGQYLEKFDPDFADGRGHAWWTHDINRAQRFASAADAMLCWKQASKVRPERNDGKPNRPLTAFSVEIRSAPLPH